jgi:hypothetical protein
MFIHGISVTSNYQKQLIRAYVEPEYIQDDSRGTKK